MATEENRKTLDQLNHALSRFDERLTDAQVDKPVEIKAIGGFALLRHGVRKGTAALTVDIDTVTRDFQPAVVDAIRAVATEQNLDVDWINNHNVIGDDPEQVEAMIGAEWLPRDEQLRNVDLRIATVETLTRAKIAAAADFEHTGRTQDPPDLIALIEHQGIKNLSEFDRKYPDEFGEYAESRKLVGAHLGDTGERDRAREAFYERHPELRPDPPDVDGPDLDEDFTF